MAYLQGFVQALAETCMRMQADVGWNYQVPVQNPWALTGIEAFRWAGALQRNALNAGSGVLRANRSPYSWLTSVSDDFDREGLAIEIDFSLPTERVVRALNQIIAERINHWPSEWTGDAWIAVGLLTPSFAWRPGFTRSSLSQTELVTNCAVSGPI